ncbi:hypothetical protein AVEN_227068-1 [Araneus ventricosus]|uniref:Uncharacterized protein n=1 Tax=Araneus ventricosus TaxID=182803 RepID=A0A4Y2UYA4_ARAVE|nr:hypothetical protein AVEN_227068-1 [Araneus ventricosus]
MTLEAGQLLSNPHWLIQVSWDAGNLLDFADVMRLGMCALHCGKNIDSILSEGRIEISGKIASLRSTAQNIKVTRHKTRQRTTSRDKHTDKNDREASWEKDGSSSATYHRKEKAADCNRYIVRFLSPGLESEERSGNS